MPHTWDPERYLAYADERGRPFVELLARIGAENPRTVVDLGCGPGNLTALLADRWPDADVLGLDASPEMVETALRRYADSTRNSRADAPTRPEKRAQMRRLDFRVGDLREWVDPPENDGWASGLVDVLVSNATLQWLPDHLDRLPALVARVRPGGWFGFQVPGNAGEPSHTIRTELAAEPRYAEDTAGVAVPISHDPATYLEALSGADRTVDAWETTYLHVLTGEDPVFTWVSGTGARPTLQALPDGLREEFEAEFKARLRAAYPAHDYGVVLPFRRIFVVARVNAE